VVLVLLTAVASSYRLPLLAAAQANCAPSSFQGGIRALKPARQHQKIKNLQFFSFAFNNCFLVNTLSFSFALHK